ncbi:hypothetical protein CY35_18G003100 [Sphagnum magellanicum]|nr:hypothetical protein CY35_18G003100 [Sphagnum magellanicum]
MTQATKWFAKGNSEDVDEIGENLVPTLVIDAIDRANEFLQNLKGIVFYSVPHTGADAYALGRYFKFQGSSTMVKDLRPFSRKMAKMSVLTEDAFYFCFRGRQAYFLKQDGGGISISHTACRPQLLQIRGL